MRNYFTGEGQTLCEIRKVVIQKRVDNHNQKNKRVIAIMNFGILVLLIAIILFALLAFKQLSALILAPVVTIFVLICSGIPIMEGLQDMFMPAAADYVSKYFLTFFVGALFGAVYQFTGAAESIARFIGGLCHGKFVAPIRTLPRQICCTNYHVYHRYSYFWWCQRFRCILRYLSDCTEPFQGIQSDKTADSGCNFSRLLDMVHVSTGFSVHSECYCDQESWYFINSGICTISDCIHY